MRPFLLCLLGGLLLYIPLAPAAAQTPGDSVRLFLLPEEVVVGSFLERSPEVWRLALRDRDPRLVPTASVRRAEVRIVRTRRALRSTSMFRGMLIGAGTGALVYLAEVGRDEADAGLGGILLIPMVGGGAVYGAGLGWVVGSLLPEVIWRPLRP
jgi:hypothetical protein